jgi:hypothetical protein
MRIFSLLLITFLSLSASAFTVDITPSTQSKIYGKIKFLDQKQLMYAQIQGMKFSELSDLAYDVKRDTLFMVSDEGKLFTFNARFTDTIDGLAPMAAVNLKKKHGKNFKKWRKDSEGMTLDGEGRLLISFEGKAKIAWFHKNSKKQGEKIRSYSLPKVLRNSKNFRSRNKSLEALAWHKKYGIVTAAEWPLKSYHKKKQTLYALSGKQWHFKAESEEKSAVSAIEVMDDGNMLVLERSFRGYLEPFVVTLKKVYLNQCKKGLCKTEVLLKMNSHRGWDVDNFEGLTRVDKNRYVMISDDNDNFFQKTLLIYFEVLK